MVEYSHVGILCYENVTEGTAFGFIRTGVTYRLNPKLKLRLGGVYVDSQPLYHNDPGTLNTQLWIYEEGALTIGKRFNHRFRLEHRWANQLNTTAFNTRLRHHPRISPHLYLTYSDEPFLDFTAGQLNQNRFFFGFGRKIGPGVSVKAGYFKTNGENNHFDRMRIALHIKTAFLKNRTKDIIRLN